MAKKIMIIDDEEVILKLLNDLLTNEGYEVVTASGGEEGIEKLKENKPDLLLLDFFMPGMTGGEVLRRIREDNQLKDLKVVFLTAASSTSMSSILVEGSPGTGKTMCFLILSIKNLFSKGFFM